MFQPPNHHNKPVYSGKPRLLFFSKRIGIASLVFTALAIPVSVATPEIRCWLHLESTSCPKRLVDTADDFYQKGSALLRLGRYVEALDSFNQAIDVDPQHAKAWNGRGLALEKLSKNQLALASYENALLLDSGYEIARQNREELLLKQKQ